jgi:copper chaperone CopZ
MNDRLTDRLARLQETTLVVEDLTCKHCIRNVLDDLRAVEGVIAARVNGPPAIDDPLDEPICGTATVKFNPDFIDPAQIRETVERHGFRVVRFQGEG